MIRQGADAAHTEQIDDAEHVKDLGQIEASFQHPRPLVRCILSHPLPDPSPGADIAALCRRMEEVVASIAKGTCSTLGAAAIVQVAAELSWTVSMTSYARRGAGSVTSVSGGSVSVRPLMPQTHCAARGREW